MCLFGCSLYGDHAFVWIMSTEKCVCLSVSVSCLVCVCMFSLWRPCFLRVTSTENCLVFLFMATMLLCGSCQLRSMWVCSLCLCLCVYSLYGDHAFVWVMSTEKCVCMCMCICVVFVCVCVCFSLWRPCFSAGHVDWEVCECVVCVCVCVCVFSLWRPYFWTGHVNWEVELCTCKYFITG